MWFMRAFRADEWLLYDQSSPSAGGGRSLCQGKIFTQSGEMVAAVMQEGLTRFKRGYRPTPVSAPRVGVLALQGDTREHLAALREAGADAMTVRRRGELDAVDGLVIPGGESTAMSHLLLDFDLLEPLRARLADGLPAYGACAGMILLASEILDAGADGRQALPLRGIDMTVRRNAFGRQVDSFEGDIAFAGPGRIRCVRCSSGRRGSSGSARACRCWPGPRDTSSRCGRAPCWRRRFTRR